jgi:ribosomal protein L11 methyltransferase
VISERLVVRPSFVESPDPRARSLIIDPGQAFGTGGHASTRLALEWIDELARREWLNRSTRVIDVGVGTGVLAMAALALGAGHGVGHDLDPLAAPEARRLARANDLHDRLQVFTGPIDALLPGRFDLVLANLLRSEMLPIAESIANAMRPDGRLILSGLLEDELDAVTTAFEAFGFPRVSRRTAGDPSGESWGALLLAR